MSHCLELGTSITCDTGKRLEPDDPDPPEDILAPLQQQDNHFTSKKNKFCGINPTQLEFTDGHHLSGRNTRERRNFEWDLLLSVCQHFHHKTCGLLACEDYARQAGNSSVCSGKMLCSITCHLPGTPVPAAGWSCCNSTFLSCSVWKTWQRRENKFRMLGHCHREGNARLYGLKRSSSGTQTFVSQIMSMHPAMKADTNRTTYASL